MTVFITDKPQRPLIGKLYIKSVIVVETGLHIGGGTENLNIGGLDKQVIRDPITMHPYIPGSSVKGKLRSILERVLPNKPINRRGSRDTYRYESDDLVSGITEIDGHFIKFEGAKTCEISRVFGSTGVACWLETEIAFTEGLLENNSPKKLINGKEYAKVKGRNFPSRLIVRDSHLDYQSINNLKKIDTGLYMTEWKFENGLDRITAAANPRQIERVPKGAKFNFEMIYTVENIDQASKDVGNLLRAIWILEDDALGGHGSRGYGKIKFQNLQVCYQDFQGIEPTRESLLIFPTYKCLNNPVEDTSKLPERFDEIQGLLPGS